MINHNIMPNISIYLTDEQIKVLDSITQGQNKIVTIEPSTFDKRCLVKYLGELEAEYLAQIKRKLSIYLKLDN